MIVVLGINIEDMVVMMMIMMMMMMIVISAQLIITMLLVHHMEMFVKVLNLYTELFNFVQIIKGRPGDASPKGPPVSFY